MKSTRRLVVSALFVAMTCVATMIIRVPTPGTGGYANLGDAIVLLGAFLLPAPCAAAAAGIGSGLADLLSGYPLYIPATVCIKALSALIASAIARKALKRAKPALKRSVGAVAAEAEMVIGYLIYEAAVLGYGAGAIASVPANIAQGIVGIAAALALTPLLEKFSKLSEL